MSGRRVVVAAASLAALTAVTGRAGADETPATPATEVVIVGTRREDRGTEVTVVDAARIERLGVTSVGTALEALPAVAGASGGRGERLLSMRGFDQRQLGVFVDGVPVAVPYDGQMDLDKLQVDLVQRIAVVKGASTMLYGPNGLGGAVNIVTREPTEGLSLRTRTETAPFRAVRSSLVASDRFGPVGALVGAGFEGVRFVPMSASFTPTPNERGGQRTNSDRIVGNLTSKWTWDVTGANRLTLAASHLDGQFGVPPATHDFTVRDWRWTDWAATTAGLSHAYRGGRLRTEEMLYVSRFTNTLDSFDDERYATQAHQKAFHSIYDDLSAGGLVRTTYGLPVGAGRQLVIRSWSGVKHDHHASQSDRGADWIAVSTTLLTTSAEADVDVVPHWLRASAGAEVDGELPDTPPSGATPSPAAGFGPMGALTFTPAHAWSFTASVAGRARFATLRERFSTVFGAREPNALLRPERAVNLAFDAVFRPAQRLRVAAGVFDSELRDVITSVIIAPQTDQMQNAGRARLIGAEVEARFAPAPWLEAVAGWMVLHAKSGDALDAPMVYKPDNKGLVMVTLAPWPTVALTGVVRSIGGQDFQNPDTARWGHLGSYRVFDARIAWAFLPGLEAWVRATNLADANVEGRYSFPEAGRQLFVGLASRVGS